MLGCHELYLWLPLSEQSRAEVLGGTSRKCSHPSLGSEHLQKRKHLGVKVVCVGDARAEAKLQPPATPSPEEEDPVSSLKSP